MNKVRLADIAEQVGVSTVTVHNALNGQKGVSDEVRERIRKVADEMGYRHGGAMGKQPRDSRFRNIGVIIYDFLLENVSGDGDRGHGQELPDRGGDPQT